LTIARPRSAINTTDEIERFVDETVRTLDERTWSATVVLERVEVRIARIATRSFQA
jgi:hypothetical protein